MSGGKKRALLIGNGSFADPRLARLFAPTEDVAAFKTVLLDPEIGGFGSVDVLTDEPLVPVRRAIAKLCAGQSPNDLLLLYYTGHGVLSADNDFYLALHETTVENPEADGLEADWLRKRMDRCRAKRQVLMLDCCHSGAFMAGRKDAGARAVTTETFGEGRYVLTASDAQSFAWDAQALKAGPEGLEGKTSLFTRLLVEGLTTGAAAPDKDIVSVQDLHTYVRGNLPADAPGMSPQIFVDRGEGELVLARNPAARFRLKDELLRALDSGENYMRLGAVIELEMILTGGEPRRALAAREALRRRLATETYVPVYKRIEAALAHPDAAASGVAADHAEPEAKKPAAPKQPLLEPKDGVHIGVDPRDLPDLAVFKDLDAPWCPEMVVIPAGEFMMGSPTTEPKRFDDEGPRHKVTIGVRFALGRYAVTFDQYDRFCEATQREKPDDKSWGRGARPVIDVSWQDAQAYVEWLSKEIGHVYRLPSEAEWEYACRAGTTAPFCFGETITPEQVNYDGNYPYAGGKKGTYRQKTLPVGTLPANPWGLHEMHGNVWEWCADHWHDGYDGAPDDGRAWIDEGADAGAYRVIRGGSWYGHARGVRSAFRVRRGPGNRYNYLGFRCARVQ